MTTKLMLLALLAVPACVLGPQDHTSVESRTDPIRFEGYTSAAHALVRIQAWNHDTSSWNTRATFNATDIARGRDLQIYQWTRTLTLPEVYWVGSAGGCESGGMALIRVQELTGSTWSTLSTFDEGGFECLNEKLGDGLDAVPAGYHCRTGDDIVLFAPPTC